MLCILQKIYYRFISMVSVFLFRLSWWVVGLCKLTRFLTTFVAGESSLWSLFAVKSVTLLLLLQVPDPLHGVCGLHSFEWRSQSTDISALQQQPPTEPLPESVASCGRDHSRLRLGQTVPCARLRSETSSWRSHFARVLPGTSLSSRIKLTLQKMLHTLIVRCRMVILRIRIARV